MKPFRISKRVSEKLLQKHSVTHADVVECFYNRPGQSFRDLREKHETDPPSMWFMSETDRGRPLKVVYVEYDDFIAIKSVYEPTDNSAQIYETLCARAKK